MEEEKRQKRTIFLIQKIFHCYLKDPVANAINCKEFYSEKLELNEELLDNIIMNCLNNSTDKISLDYLVKCLEEVESSMYLDKEMVALMQRKIVDYVVIILQMPEAFPAKDTIETMIWRMMK